MPQQQATPRLFVFCDSSAGKAAAGGVLTARLLLQVGGVAPGDACRGPGCLLAARSSGQVVSVNP